MPAPPSSASHGDGRRIVGDDWEVILPYGDSFPWRDALPSAEQLSCLDANEASQHFRREQRDKYNAARACARSRSLAALGMTKGEWAQ